MTETIFCTTAATEGADSLGLIMAVFPAATAPIKGPRVTWI
jgi:hypothetical protein